MKIKILNFPFTDSLLRSMIN